MATLQVSCPCCGDQARQTKDLRLVSMPDGKKYYSFLCNNPLHPQDMTDDEGAVVSKLVMKRVEERTWELLINTGVAFKVLTDPLELRDTQRQPEAHPPLDNDDLIDMHTRYFDGLQYEPDRSIVGEPTQDANTAFTGAYEGMRSHYPSEQLQEEYPALRRMHPGKER